MINWLVMIGVYHTVYANTKVSYGIDPHKYCWLSNVSKLDEHIPSTFYASSSY